MTCATLALLVCGTLALAAIAREVDALVGDAGDAVHAWRKRRTWAARRRALRRSIGR